MSQTEAWTIGRLLTWTTDYFRQHGAAQPRLEAEVLLAAARRCERIDLYVAFGETAGEDLRGRFRELVKQRAAGTPVAYLIGQREFYSLPFHVTPAVLIPRPETEFLVLALLDLAKAWPTGDGLRICDVGTGSGILAVCAAKYLETARVTAVDVSPAALEVARRNARRHGVEERITWVESDLLAGVGGPFDVVLSNPPYVSESEFGQLSREVRDHEPRGALVAGPTGCEVIARLVPEAAARLAEGGWLIFEISPMIRALAEQCVVAEPRLQLFPTQKDLAGLPRVVRAQRAAGGC